jgi:NADH-quinone oxidoreductase subunit G
MVNIEINGQPLEVREGSMVIEAADAAGITIPRFCYHKKLSIAANCRMCLVDVEKAPKPLPACATPVMDGMRIFTRSARAIEAQKSVMEFLLINHPLDCPICDQGGECELQDLAMGYGEDVSRYAEGKRVVADKYIGPLISTEMTRCIHCTRCVRFGQEIAGVMELGATGRGEHTRIGLYIEGSVNSEMSGNMIDLCPVGALTSRPFRYTSRPWELIRKSSVAAHDCVGSNLYLDTRRDIVMRVVPSENDALNEVWLSDRDRFSYTGMYHDDRLTRPMIKQGDDWKEVEWETALGYALEGLKTVQAQKGADQIGALISPSASLEEHYLLQKLLRGIGSNNVDHRLRQQDFSDQDIAPVAPVLGQSVADLEQLDAALLIGSWVRKDQPIVAHRLRQAAQRGASIMVVNALDYEFNFRLAEKLISAPAQMVDNLAAICKALLTLSGKPAPAGLDALLENVSVHDAQLEIARHLFNARQVAVLIGNQAMNQAELASLRALANAISELADARLGYLTEGANAVGASLAGSLPHRGPAGAGVDTAGLDTRAMLTQGLAAYILFGLEPEYDCANPGQAVSAMHAADFVVSLSAFVTDRMRDYADVILPISLFPETGGTFVNAEGNWQSFEGAVKPVQEARPGWKVLRVLGNLFDVEGFEYVSVTEVRDDLATQTGSTELSTRSDWRCPASLGVSASGLMRIGPTPMYAVDPLVRRAPPLQETTDAIVAAVYLNNHTAAAQQVKENTRVRVEQGSHTAELPVVIDAGVPDNCVFIPAGVAGSGGLGEAYGPMEFVHE